MDLVQDVALIRESWALVERNAERLTRAFYERLFELEPDLEPLFALTEIEAQSAKFLAMLRIFVQLIDEPDEIGRILRESGRRHEGYGVRPRDYQTVGEAFLWALEKELGPAFDSPTRAAWAEAYTRMASIMKQGQTEQYLETSDPGRT